MGPAQTAVPMAADSGGTVQSHPCSRQDPMVIMKIVRDDTE